MTIGLRTIWLGFVFIAAAAIGLAQVKGEPTTISGPARVLDGDSVVVGTVHVRLKGVDAPERYKPLGEESRRAMIEIVGDSPLRCELTGEHTWGREVGFCFTVDGRDIGQAIIERGAALACARYSTRYVVFEQPAAVAAQPRSSYCVRR